MVNTVEMFHVWQYCCGIAPQNDCARGELLVTFFRPRYSQPVELLRTGPHVLRVFLRGLEIKFRLRAWNGRVSCSFRESSELLDTH